jgi:hypothetical protein
MAKPAQCLLNVSATTAYRRRNISGEEKSSQGDKQEQAGNKD